MQVCPMRKGHPSSFQQPGVQAELRFWGLTVKGITKWGGSSEPTSPQNLNAPAIKRLKISKEINAEKDLHQGCPLCVISNPQSTLPVDALGQVPPRPEHSDECLRLRRSEGLLTEEYADQGPCQRNNFPPARWVFFFSLLKGNSIDIHLGRFSLGLSWPDC